MKEGHEEDNERSLIEEKGGGGGGLKQKGMEDAHRENACERERDTHTHTHLQKGKNIETQV